MERGPSSQKSAHYKKINGLYLVPRESFLKTQLADFLKKTHDEKPIIVGSYQTATHQTQVATLPFFGPYQEKMPNGHVPSRDRVIPYEILRCLTLQVGEEGIKGAIKFSIDFKQKSCHIISLAIDANYKRKHFGSILLHCAIFVAVHYQCTKISLYSSHEGMHFYPTQGFKKGDLFILDFNDAPSRALFLRRAQQTCPSFDERALASLLAPAREEEMADQQLEKYFKKTKKYIFDFDNFENILKQNNLIDFCFPYKNESSEILLKQDYFSIKNTYSPLFIKEKSIFNLINKDYYFIEKSQYYFPIKNHLIADKELKRPLEDPSSDSEEPPKKRPKFDL